MDPLEPVSYPSPGHPPANSGAMNSDRIVCNGCKLTLEDNGAANDSVVVSFGNSLWHVDCFRCAKCRNLVEHDTNLLLLSDGSPVCENCSYICSVCKQPISNEAIVTGEESYHADCFRCRSCSNRIEELIFAKTSQGIYCMTCHNQRVTRSRRHAEAKRSKASTQPSSKPRDRPRDRDKDRPRDRDHSHTRTTANASDPSYSHSAPFVSHLPVDPVSNPRAHHLASPLAPNLPSSLNKPLYTSNSQPSLVPTPNASPRLNPSASTSPHQPRPSTSSDLGLLAQPSKSSSANFVAPHHRGGSTSSFQQPVGSDTTRPDPNKLRTSPSVVPRPSSADGGRSPSSSPRPSPFAPAAVINRSYESSPHLYTIPDPAVHTGPVSPSKSSYRFQPQKSKLLGISSDAPAFRSVSKHRSVSLDSLSNIAPTLGPTAARTRVDPDPTSHRLAITSPSPLFSYSDIFSSLDHNSSSPLASSLFNDPPRSSNQLDAENFSPSCTSHEPHDALIISASHPVQNGDMPNRSNNFAEGEKGDYQDLGVDLGLVEKLIRELDEINQRMKALRDEYHQIAKAPPSSLEGSISSTARPPNIKREDAELKMRELGVRMAEQASMLKALGSCTSLEYQSEQLKGSVCDLQNHLRQLVIERDFRVTEIEALTSVRDQLKRDGKLHQPVEQIFTAKFQQVRNQYLGDIRELAGERDQLIDELTHLNKVRESQAKEFDSLNQRYDALSEMNAAAVRQLEETRHIATQIQGGPAGPSNFKAMVSPPTAGLNISPNEPGLPPEVTIATPRKFKWGKSHAQKTSTPAVNLKNNHHQIQNSGIPTGIGADLVPTNNDIITISNNHSSGVNDGNPQTTSNNSAANNNNLNSINTTSSSNLAGVTHHSGNNNHGVVGSGGNNTAIISSSSLSSTQHQPQQNSSNNNNNSSINPNLRPHTFQPVSALRPVRCDYCGDKLWGLAEVRCTACGSYSHTKCAANFFGCLVSSSGPGHHGSTSLTSLGLTATSNHEEEVDSVLFGHDLVLQAKQENKFVPSIVSKCIEAIERHGLKFEGIYRKTGGMSSVKMIQNCFETGTSMNFNDLDKFNDISAITSTLKNYFRQLPNPLFTFELHEAFVTVATMASETIRLEALERVIYQLPLVHFETLKVLMTHLSNIEKLSEFNKMSSQNLGVIFGPTLLRSPNPNRQFSDMPFTAKIVELTVVNKFNLFRKAHGFNPSAAANANSHFNSSSSNDNNGVINQPVQQPSSTNPSSHQQPNPSGFSTNSLGGNVNSLSHPVMDP